MKIFKNNSEVVRFHYKKQQKTFHSEDSFSPFNIFFWIHGIGFTTNFMWAFKPVVLFIISVVFFIIFEGNTIYAMIAHYNSTYNGGISKRNCVLYFLFILEGMLRIILYINRRKFNALNKRLLKIYAALSSRNLMKFKYVTFFVLVINDILDVFVIVALHSEENLSHILKYLGDNHTYGYIKAPHSTPAFYASLLISDWSAMTYIVPIYFCCFCYILKRVICAFREKLIIMSKTNFDLVHLTYHNIYNLICLANRTFHAMLLITFTVFIAKVFNACYFIIFEGEYRTINRISPILLLPRFALMCIFSASVINAASDLKEGIYGAAIPLNAKWESTRLFCKMNNDFFGFKLLGNIIIDNTLILSSVGILVTYGMLYTTFNVNSNR